MEPPAHKNAVRGAEEVPEHLAPSMAMPEGHVSHRNALRLTAALAGQELLRVEAPEQRLTHQRIPERLHGDRVAVVEAAGKHHVVRFDSGRVLHSHLGMVGVWRVFAAGSQPRTGGLWLLLETPKAVVAQYRGSTLQLLEPGAPIPRVAELGPDLLADDMDASATLVRRLARVDPARTIGDVLMDQRVVAGIGNVFKSETLFLCGIDPWRPVGSISPDEAGELGATARRLMQMGVTDQRISTYRPDGRVGQGTKWVYRRVRQPCRRCGTPIRSRGQGDSNRTTYWCPQCQS
jgi:endonuclease VIII